MITARDAAAYIAFARGQRFIRAQNTVKKVVALLVNKYGARKVVLIGSLADKNRFGFHSDIDLCVAGLPDTLYFRAVGECLVLSGEFDIDIIPYENLPPHKREQVMKGKVLYEER